MLMFHGTSTDAAKRIMQQGFTLKLVGQRQRAVHGDDTLDPKGVFVTSDPLKAKWYAGPDPKRPGLNRGGAVIEVKVNGRIMPTKKWWELKRQINDEMGLGMWDPRRGEAVLRAQEEAQKQGYAGFHEDGDEYVIFNPRDLKPVRAYLADNEEPLPRTASVSSFMSDYKRETEEADYELLRNHRVWWDEMYECAVGMALEPHRDHVYIKIIRIEDVDCFGRGKASAVLRHLIRMADKHKVTLALTPEATGSKTLDTSQLKGWYKRMGFAPKVKGSSIFDKSWVRHPGGKTPKNEEWELLIETPGKPDRVWGTYFAENIDLARDHAMQLSTDRDKSIVGDGEITAFRQDGGRWRKLAHPSRVAARHRQAGLDDDYVELLRKKISLKEFLQRQPKIKAVETQRLDALPDSGLSKGYDYDCFVHAELRAVQLSDAKSYREVDWEPVGIDGAGTTPPRGAEIPWSKAKRGDWVRWPGLGGHHGVVIDPKRKIVESCWGYKGIVFQHPIDHHPYGKGGKIYPVRPKEAASRVAARYITAASLSVEEYYGKAGRKDHLTRYEKGTIPTKDALKIEPPRRYHGKRKWHTKGGERYFGNYTEEDWNEFLEDIRKNGIKTPLWIQKDPGEDAALMEGNHRVQAADQLGIREVPVYIRYYGLSEEEGLAAPSVRRTIKHQDPERVKAAAQRVAHRYLHRYAGKTLFHLSPEKFSRFSQQSLGSGYNADLGFHFGTKDTALTASGLLAGKGRIKKGDTVYLYELDIDAGKPLVLDENRRGSWSLHDLIRSIFEGGPGGGPLPFITDAEFDDYYGQDEDGNDTERGEGVFTPSRTNLKELNNADQQRREFLSWLNAHGFNSVKYKNTYEGGGDSYIVFDPNQIKIKSVTPYTYDG